MFAETNPLDSLEVYGIARDVAMEAAKGNDQQGTPVFGFKQHKEGYEVVTGAPEDLAEYNIDFNIVASDTEFNLIVRKDNPQALRKLPKKTLRQILRNILDSV